jgi:predicted ester cyclase
MRAAASGNIVAAMKETNQAVIVRYFEEVWNRGRLEVLDEIIDPEYVNHSPGSPLAPPLGPSGLKPIVAHMRSGIADLHYRLVDLVVSDEKVAAYVHMTGVHTGMLFGMAPRGGKIDVMQMQFEWLRDGRIYQHWRITEDKKLVEQLLAASN